MRIFNISQTLSAKTLTTLKSLNFTNKKQGSNPISKSLAADTVEISKKTAQPSKKYIQIGFDSDTFNTKEIEVDPSNIIKVSKRGKDSLFVINKQGEKEPFRGTETIISANGRNITENYYTNGRLSGVTKEVFKNKNSEKSVTTIIAYDRNMRIKRYIKYFEDESSFEYIKSSTNITTSISYIHKLDNNESEKISVDLATNPKTDNYHNTFKYSKHTAQSNYDKFIMLAENKYAFDYGSMSKEELKLLAEKLEELLQISTEDSIKKDLKAATDTFDKPIRTAIFVLKGRAAKKS